MIQMKMFFYLHVYYVLGTPKCKPTPFKTEQDNSSSALSWRKIKDICALIPKQKYTDWLKNPRGQGRFLVSIPRKLSYCVLHEDIDDIWRRIFEVLRTTNGNEVDLTRKVLPNISAIIFDNDKLKDTETILYVRNPFARLYMVYNDRFYLAYGTDSRHCETLPFQEFLDKVITHVKLRLNWGLSRFAPVIPKCRLCDIKVFEVVREEHFIDDMEIILRKVDCSDITNGLKVVVHDTIMSFVKRRHLVMYAIVLAKLKYQNTLCNNNETGPRLWRSLQIMGYINRDVSYPQTLYDVDVSFHPDRLVKSALQESPTLLTDPEKVQQKNIILAEAYSGIKEITIEYIQEIYKYDFQMFGYSNKRPSI